VITFTLRLLCPLKELWMSIAYEAVGPRNRSGRCGLKDVCCFCRELNPVNAASSLWLYGLSYGGYSEGYDIVQWEWPARCLLPLKHCGRVFESRSKHRCQGVCGCVVLFRQWPCDGLSTRPRSPTYCLKDKLVGKGQRHNKKSVCNNNNDNNKVNSYRNIS
jgi:hypothetical protein